LEAQPLKHPFGLEVTRIATKARIGMNDKMSLSLGNLEVGKLEANATSLYLIGDRLIA